MTRGTPRCCEAVIELPILQKNYDNLVAENTRLMQDNASLRRSLEKARNKNTILAMAQSEAEGKISYMAPESGMWSKEVDVLVAKLKRWNVDNVLELCTRACYRMLSSGLLDPRISLVGCCYTDACMARTVRYMQSYTDSRTAC